MKGQKFTRLSLGKNTIGRVGVQVATELCLARPEIYTGHCWRRSCGTSASDSGVNVTTLMAMMGWSNPKTAMVYVKKSRLTSLSLSLYLANVQRQNCSNPFPKQPVEKRQAIKESHVSSSVVAKCSNTLVSSCNREVSSESASSHKFQLLLLMRSGRVGTVVAMRVEVLFPINLSTLIQDWQEFCITCKIQGM